MIRKIPVLIILLNVVFPPSIKALPFSSKLSESEQRAINETIGIGSGSTYAENLYALGGYQGFRLSLLSKYLSLQHLRQFSSGLNQVSDILQYELVLSKGLFHNIDFWGGFGPKTGNNGSVSFSGGVKWMAWESGNYPLSLGLILAIRQVNYHNQITVHNQTTDLFLNYFLHNFFSYFCFGIIRTNSQFIGGPYGVTISGETESLSRSLGRPLFGFGYRFLKKIWLGVEIGHVADTFTALKISYDQ
ncbi:MAG: hypothetical protein NZ480_04295 [Bdellovibrionaceae bacterium]|nr:hypothetical protein [Pseudobdellovibrionaceae bacterium]MDW8189967.1 hypothetical protein [Pseudobdellovibrionaceae bacterium]